jgi:glycerol uptake facilitator-like aquaporin
MSISFFLNVAVGAGLGPTAVALAAQSLFKGALGPAITLVAAGGYGLAVLALIAVWSATRLPASGRRA